MIHLKHKDHGYHIAYTEEEAKRCERFGWTRCDMEKEHEAAREAKAAAARAIEEEKAEGERVAEEVKKRGRPRKES